MTREEHDLLWERRREAEQRKQYRALPGDRVQTDDGVWHLVACACPADSFMIETPKNGDWSSLKISYLRGERIVATIKRHAP